LLGSTHPKARHAASQEGWSDAPKTLASLKRGLLDSSNIHKIPWRNDSYPARAASAGRIAVSGVQAGQNGKAAGIDFANVKQADLTRLAGRRYGGGGNTLGCCVRPAFCRLHEIHAERDA
jgi:hypothetical protein